MSQAVFAACGVWLSTFAVRGACPWCQGKPERSGGSAVMRGPRWERGDAVPVSWEIPAAAATGWAVIAALLLPAAQGVAAWLCGAGWVWPRGAAGLASSVGGLLTGRPGRGLGVDEAARVPAAALVYGTVGVAQGLLVAATATAVLWWWRHLGPGARPGMADRAEVRRVLGAARLRRAGTLIRPDLSGHPGRGTAADLPGTRFDPVGVGWRLGRSEYPRGVELWVPFDRTCGVYGPQGSGKTLDLLAPALLAAPGAALVTLTKLDDLLLTLDRRAAGGRPVAVLDPFGVAAGVPELVWDPVAGCADPALAERRAKAFTVGAVAGAAASGFGDAAARFYAAEAAKVLQAYLHAAALAGGTLEQVLGWLADPRHAGEPEEILRTHPHAAPHWDGLLRGALHGDPRTAGNTAATVQQAMSLFFQPGIRGRCVPGPGRPATDLAELIARRGTVYLLGREDPYASASPLLTAVAEHVLDVALGLANASRYGRLCPPLLACLDELPSTAPLPTLRTRMANERALGISFIYAAQTWRQLAVCYSEEEARALFGLTNTIVIFGGGKDGRFYTEVADLLGTTRIRRTTHTRSAAGWGRSTTGHDEPVLRPEQIRQLPDRHALVVAENARPLLARLTRCIDGSSGRALLAGQAAARARIAAAQPSTSTPTRPTVAARPDPRPDRAQRRTPETGHQP